MIRIPLGSLWVYCGPGDFGQQAFRVAMFADGEIVAVGMTAAWLGQPDEFLVYFRPLKTIHT